MSESVLRRTLSRLRRRRVPVLLQLNALECGAACLAMLLSYHGRQTRVAECRDRCDLGRDGLTTLAIVQAARSFGLRVKSYSVEPSAFQYLPLPAIAHWQFNHYVVVERWSPKGVDIVDPAVGRRRLSASELDAGLTGLVLTFEPGGQLEPAGAKPAFSWLALLRTHLRESPGIVAQVLCASIALQMLGLALPLCSKWVVDEVLPFPGTNLMTPLAIGMGLLAATQLVLGYLRATLLLYLQARVDLKLMPGLLEHLLTLPFRFFEQRTSGDLLMRLASNAILRDTLTSQTLSIVLDGGLVVGYLALLLLREPLFGLVVLLFGTLQVGLMLGSARRMGELTSQDVLAQSDTQGYLVEALGGISTLKASGAEDRALDHFLDLFFKQVNVSLRRNHLSALLDTAMTTLRICAPLAMLWVGALRVLDGSMSVGTMLALNALGAAFLMPLNSLVQNGQRLTLLGAHLERLADVMQARPEQTLESVRPAPRISGRVELRNVSFRYDARSPWVLKDVSLTIEPGQTVALVGRTGCGKTTLVKLLLGLYPPVEGQILYDGIPLEQLNYRTLRAQFGVVLQESFMFSGSIRDNIAFSDRSLPLDKVVKAARLAAIHDDLEQLPMGYETRLAEGGGGLSGGQRQRLSIARALSHDPAILFLDEATSHLDVKTERTVEQNVRSLACTRILIAHRLSTVRHADQILVVDQGTIVERGSHAELLAKGGHYAALVRSQDPGLPEALESPRGPGEAAA